MITIKQLTQTAGLVIFSACLPALAHVGHGDELPWQACSQAQKNDPCKYSNSHGDQYIGNCKLFNQALMCVRNQPIVRGKVSKPAAEQLKNEASKVKVELSTPKNQD